MDSSPTPSKDRESRLTLAARAVRDFIVKLTPKQKLSKIGSAVVIALTIVGIYLTWHPNYIAEAAREAQKIQDARRYAILLPLYCGTDEYLQFMTSPDPLNFYLDPAVEPPKEPKKGDRLPPGRKVSNDVWSAAHSALLAWNRWLADKGLAKGIDSSTPNARVSQVTLIPFPEGYDKETYAKALLHVLEAAEKAGIEVAVSVGHVTSSAAQEYAELYGSTEILNVKKPRIPVIVNLATSTSLLDYMLGKGVPSVLRLVPNNDAQAKVIADSLTNLKPAAMSAIAVADRSNPAYSTDLIERFREYYVRLPLRNNSPNGEIVGVFPAGEGLAPPFMFASVKGLNADTLILFGMTETILESLTQARSTGVSPSVVFLTDGAIDEYLLSRLAKVLARGQGTVGRPRVFISFPLADAEPPQLVTLLKAAGVKRTDDFAMTHAVYAADAVTIAAGMIQKHVVEAAAKRPTDAIVAAMEEIKAKPTALLDLIRVSIPSPLLGDYEFGPSGENTLGRYHVFSVRFPTGGLPMWVHDVAVCATKHDDSVGGQASRRR